MVKMYYDSDCNLSLLDGDVYKRQLIDRRGQKILRNPLPES